MAKRTTNPSTVEDRIRDAQARIEAATQSFRDGEQWQAFLRHAARFHRYSANNQLLIWSQSEGTATHVAGFKAWLERERCVRKGESALWIYAPMTKQNTETGEREVCGFRLVPVFDVAQTDVIEGATHPFMPMQSAPIDGDDAAGSELYGRLVEAAVALGVTSVAVGESHGNAHYNTRNKAIVIGRYGTSCEAAMLLAHEIAHHVTWKPANDDQALSYDQGELIAESVAYIVGQYYGIESEVRSAHYITTWMDANDDVSFDKGMALIQRAARTIIDHVEKAHGVIEDAEVAA